MCFAPISWLQSYVVRYFIIVRIMINADLEISNQPASLGSRKKKDAAKSGLASYRRARIPAPRRVYSKSPSLSLCVSVDPINVENFQSEKVIIIKRWTSERGGQRRIRLSRLLARFHEEVSQFQNLEPSVVVLPSFTCAPTIFHRRETQGRMSR